MIQIDEHYSVENDGTCWTLRYRKEGELNDKGVPKLSQSQTYHTTIDAALKWYLHETLKTSESLTEVLSAIAQTEKNILEAVKNL